MHNAGVYEFGLDRRSVARMFEVNVRRTSAVLAAAGEAGVPRCLHVSSTMALGPSGYPPAPPSPADETQVHPDRDLTPHERSKTEAHAVAPGLPAFLSRDTVDASRGHDGHSVAKAQRDLGWSHPQPGAMRDAIVRGERALLEQRRGFLNRLRQQAVVPD